LTKTYDVLKFSEGYGLCFVSLSRRGEHHDGCRMWRRKDLPYQNTYTPLIFKQVHVIMSLLNFFLFLY